MKEYKRRLEISGKNEFYCSVRCRNNIIKTDEFTPFRTFLSLCKKNVKHKNFDCDLDLSFLKELWEKQKGICPYTNIKMLLFPTMNKTEFKPDAASLDRINSSKGYIKGNVHFVCLSINYAKNKFGDDDFKNFLKRIRRED